MFKLWLFVLHFRQKALYFLGKSKNTTPSIPVWSPTTVLTGLFVAWLTRSDGFVHFLRDMVVSNNFSDWFTIFFLNLGRKPIVVNGLIYLYDTSIPSIHIKLFKRFPSLTLNWNWWYLYIIDTYRTKNIITVVILLLCSSNGFLQ